MSRVVARRTCVSSLQRASSRHVFFLPSAAVPQALERLDGVVEAVRQYAQVGLVGRALGGSAAVALVVVVVVVWQYRGWHR